MRNGPAIPQQKGCEPSVTTVTSIPRGPLGNSFLFIANNSPIANACVPPTPRLLQSPVHTSKSASHPKTSLELSPSTCIPSPTSPSSWTSSRQPPSPRAIHQRSGLPLQRQSRACGGVYGDSSSPKCQRRFGTGRCTDFFQEIRKYRTEFFFCSLARDCSPSLKTSTCLDPRTREVLNRPPVGTLVRYFPTIILMHTTNQVLPPSTPTYLIDILSRVGISFIFVFTL